MTVADPAQYFRTMLAEWEKMANALGGQMLKSEEWTRAMNGAQAAGLSAQTAYREMSDRALAAANLPSRTEFEDLSARIGRIEASLARIETALGATAPSARPRPTRGRRPPGAPA